MRSLIILAFVGLMSGCADEAPRPVMPSTPYSGQTATQGYAPIPPSTTAPMPGSATTGAHSAAVPDSRVPNGSLANVSAVVADMAASFRRCYSDGLREDPNLRGAIKVTTRVGPSGQVLSADAASEGSLSPSVVECVRARVASAQFSPPEGGGATIVIPVTLMSQ